MKISTIMLAAVVLLASTAAYSQQITGAGSTFGGPIYAKWGEAVKNDGIQLNYQNIGSGGGINQVTNRTVDFGGTDMPLSTEKLAESKLMQFPTVIGGVVVIVNIPGIASNQLKLTGDIVAKIYLGKITKWNDAAIAEINPGVSLPKLTIAPIYRADGSGTTFVFTNYLSSQNDDWKTSIGSNSSVKWPAGNGAKGNDGISASTKQVKGSIGYVESAYAANSGLITTQLRNKSGKFVSPTFESFSAAAANADWDHSQNFAVNLNDQPGEMSWPIESATFVLLPLDPKDQNVGNAVRKMFDVSFATGNDAAKSMLYVPLPTSVQNAVRAAWKTHFSN